MIHTVGKIILLPLWIHHSAISRTQFVLIVNYDLLDLVHGTFVFYLSLLFPFAMKKLWFSLYILCKLNLHDTVGFDLLSRRFMSRFENIPL